MGAEEGGKHQRLTIDEIITLRVLRYHQLRSLSVPRFALLPVYVHPFRRDKRAPFLQLGLPHATRNQRISDTSGLKPRTHPVLGKS